MITTLITGGSLEDRLKEIDRLTPNLPYPPINLDGREEGITIKTVREWSHDINLSVDLNSLQRHFILEAQSLSLPAQNALLKILEEPPLRTQIILTSDTTNSLLETILSRCHVITLKTVSSFDSSSLNFLGLIIKGSYADLIKLAGNLSKSNPEVEITSLLHFFHHHLTDKPTLSRAQAIKTLNQSLIDLKTNGNKQLILEHLFFTLKSLVH